MGWSRLDLERQRVAILDHHPDLAEALSDEDLSEARRVLVAPALTLPRGEWSPRDGLVRPPHLSVFVIDGLLTRRIALGETVCAELLGPGDLLRPWDRFGDGVPMPFEVSWQVLEESRIVLLGERFAAAAARWPALTGALVGRAIRRAHSLALSQAIGCTAGLELRLLILFWHFAERWGRVRGDGVLVPLALTHETIGQLIGARRPSVSSSLKLLEREGVIRRLGRKGWILTLEPSAVVEWTAPRRGGPERGAPRPPGNAECVRGPGCCLTVPTRGLTIYVGEILRASRQ